MAEKSRRNSLAGKSTGTSKSAKYYAKNKEANKKKLAYMKEYNKDPKKVKYRQELNKANKKSGTYGKMTKMGKDRSHTKEGKLVLENRKTNRARQGSGGGSTKK